MKNKHTHEAPAEVEVADRAPAGRGSFGPIGLDEWFDRWPELFARRWPEALRGMPMLTEPFRLEEFTDTDGTFVLRAELPGLDPDEDIEITIEDGMLRIDAHREQRTEDREHGRFRSEFRYGALTRRVALPEGADEDHCAATFDAGILEVRVPVRGDLPPAKKVPVTTTK
jgi:HSP20 family protein